MVTALLSPSAVPIIRPAISPIAQPVRQCKVAFAAMLLREFIRCPLCRTSCRGAGGVAFSAGPGAGLGVGGADGVGDRASAAAAAQAVVGTARRAAHDAVSSLARGLCTPGGYGIVTVSRNTHPGYPVDEGARNSAS